jgi:hypothetical protein
MARGAGMIPRPMSRPVSVRAVDPAKSVLAPPRIKPISTRDYGKGGTPMSGSPDLGVRGAGIGYGGMKPYGP